MQNQAFAAHGIAVRVDHRSLAEQGIREREPGLHQGPAVAGIEARGETSRVAERQRQQIAERQAQRENILQAGLALERERLAAERMAARERRHLVAVAAQAPAAERAAFERLLERDRQVQLERTADAAERRVERREDKLTAAAPAQRRLVTRLVDQGQALTARLGHALGRVKDWAQTRMTSLSWARSMDRSAAAAKRPTAEELRAQGLANWLAMRAAAKTQELTPEQTRQQAVKNWLAYRAMTPEQRQAWDLEQRSKEREMQHGLDRSAGLDGPEFD